MEELRDAGLDIQMLTSGNSLFQSHVLEVHGLRDLFSVIWGRDNVQGIVVPKRYVWVDDLEPRMSGFGSKGEWLGMQPMSHSYTFFCPQSEDMIREEERADYELWRAFHARHYVQCRPYIGQKDDPQSLTELLPEVLRKLEAQS